MQPTLQQLRYLVALADMRHFRRAAESCGVTQPTLSAQLKELEERLGVDLVERSRSRLVITPTGQRVTSVARRILNDLEEIGAIASSGRGFLESMIRVGVVQTLGSYLLPLFIPELHASHPRLGLYPREGLPADLLHGVSSGTLDVLLFPLPVDRADLDKVALFREPIHVVAPSDHRLATYQSIEPQMLRGETVLSLEPGHRLYEQVRLLCEEYGATVSRSYEGTSLDTLRQMVAMGMGLALMPALYVKSEVAHQDIVVARPFRTRPPVRTIGMVWRRGTAREPEYRALAKLICGCLARRAPEVLVL